MRLNDRRLERMTDLLQWGLIALLISMGAGALGFSGVARGASTAAKWLFGIFLVIAVVLGALFIMGMKILF
jgi:uncharacterized membrane protein YtjA (UPF0391 family)